MSEKIVVPVLGESITEATVSKWLKNEGDLVEVDEPIVELETDKVNLEVPSPISGTLSEINSKDGATVEVGALLGSISESGTEVIKNESISKIEPTSNQNNIVNIEIPEKQNKTAKKLAPKKTKTNDPLVLNNEIDEPLVLKNEVEEKAEDQILSPAVRKIIAEKKIDIKDIKGTGKDGRILKGDLISLMGIQPQPSER